MYALTISTILPGTMQGSPSLPQARAYPDGIPGARKKSLIILMVQAEGRLSEIVQEYNTKGHKNNAQPAQVKHLAPIGENHVCLIAWLLIHALRHGLMKGGPSL
jgi:hypothetical protein